MYEGCRKGNGGEMMKKIYAKKIYVFCPAGVKTGGPELLHQLVYALNQNKKSASIVYTGKINHSYKIIDEYLQYIDSYLLPEEVEDSAENLVIVPETLVLALKRFKKIQTLIWWLSVDNFYFNFLSLRALKFRSSNWGFLRAIKRSIFNSHTLLSMKSRLIKKIDFHLCQSQYAIEECKKYGYEAYYLSDYLNDQFFTEKTETLVKENIVAYSPVKGFRFTRKIIDKNPGLNFFPIINMTRAEVQNLLKKAKVYIDFGNHPGMDRIPREARMQGCVVITGKNGSAKYTEDVPIEEKFERKTCNIKAISNLIKDIFDNYEKWNEKQMNYTDFIKGQKDQFLKDVKSIFNSENRGRI